MQIYKFSLVCSEIELERRMLLGGRSLDGIKESIERNKLYYGMNIIKIDTSDKSVDDVIGEIKNLMKISNEC